MIFNYVGMAEKESAKKKMLTFNLSRARKQKLFFVSIENGHI